MPSINPLAGLFGRSPIGPTQEHMRVANEAAQLLPELIAAACEGDWDRAGEAHKGIVEAERAADKLKRSVRRHLPKSLFLPVPRSDLLSLVSIQDQLADTAKDICGLVIERKMEFPEPLREDVLDYTHSCVAASQQALTAIQELDELLEVGFSGREVKLVESMLKELDKMERRSDKKAARLRAKLFKMESELPPVDVMFHYRVFMLLGALSNCAESVGDRLQILMAK